MKRFMSLNGLAVAGIMENVLLLYALRNGLSEALTGVLASFVFFTMPLMILGRRLTARFGLARAWSLCWTARYLVVLPMLIPPVLRGSAGEWLTPWLILVPGFALFALRSMGMVNTVALQGDLCREEDRGGFLSSLAMRFQSMFLTGSLLIVLAMRYWNSLATYQVIILTCAAVGFLSSRTLRRIPETPTLRESARTKIFGDIALIFRRPAYRRLAPAWTAAECSFILVMPFAIMAVKRIYGVADQDALLFALVSVLGGVAASWILGFLVDEIGPRPLLILALVAQIGVALFWAFAPAGEPWILLGMVFFAMGAVRVSILIGLQHYMLGITPPEERIGIAMWLQMLSGFGSGLAGMVLGSGLLSLLDGMVIDSRSTFVVYFRVIAGLLLFAIALLFRLQKQPEWAIRDILGLLLSVRDMRALYVINKLRTSVAAAKDPERTRRLEELGAAVSDKTFDRIVRPGPFTHRARALASLARDAGRDAERNTPSGGLDPGGRND
jgi:MFS family permease